METSNLRINKNKKKKRVGRGGKKGTYSGKGMNGQKSRAGRKFQPFIRELMKRYHKLRGYKQQARIKDIVEVKVGKLNIFSDGAIVDKNALLEKKIISTVKRKIPSVKILIGGGELRKKIILKDCLVSKRVRKEIEKNGGKVENKGEK